MDTGENSVIVAAKLLLESVVKAQLGNNFTVAKNKVEELNARTSRVEQFVSILTADGSFDERSAKTYKYQTVDKTPYTLEIRGKRKVPIELRVYAKTENDTDPILEEILSYLPSSWKIGQRQGAIGILTEHSNDYASNYKDGSMASCFIMFEMEIGKKPVQNMIIKNATINKEDEE